MMAKNNTKKQKRGILGYLKPPEPMLFSFLPNSAQEWPSDDDDGTDSDYDPREFTDGEENNIASCTSKSMTKKKISSRTRKKSSKGKLKEKIPREAPNVRRTKRQKTLVLKCLSQLSYRTHLMEIQTKNQDTVTSVSLESEGQVSLVEGHQLWGQRLPLIVLQNIFQYAVQMEGAIPFLCRVCRVCRLWRDAANHSSLWQHMDLANGRLKCRDATLEWLATNRLSRLRSISLGGWTKLTDAGVKALVKHCPHHLTSVNLSRCSKITAESICSLVDACPLLHSLDLSHASADAVCIASMTHVLKTLGDRLRLLNLAGNKLKGISVILKALVTHCHNLLILDISNCTFSSDFMTLHIEELQCGCPKLEVFRLAGCMVRANSATKKVQAESTGFPHLQELSLAVNTDTVASSGRAIDDNMLLRLLVKSHKLRLLDLRGCTCISATGIEKLPVYDLEHLFISQCSVSQYEGIVAVVQKWRHSLLELDLSWNIFSAVSLDIAMKKLSTVPSRSVLKDINLAGTSVTLERVRSILDGCTSLESINLASCRGLPRGMKRSYQGDCLEKLKEDLQSASTDTSEHIE